MASICDSSSTTISTVREQMDDREFTVSGKDFQMPKSPAKRANHHGNSMAKSEKKSSKTSRLRPFSMPVIAPISPEDLDLESTLVAGESFVSSNSNSGERQDINCSETLSLGNTTSYSRAVHRGRLESVAISKSVCTHLLTIHNKNSQKKFVWRLVQWASSFIVCSTPAVHIQQQWLYPEGAGWVHQAQPPELHIPCHNIMMCHCPLGVWEVPHV